MRELYQPLDFWSESVYRDLSQILRQSEGIALAKFNNACACSSCDFSGPIALGKGKVMNFRAISAWKPAGLTTVHSSNEGNGLQPLRSLVSRRQFARTTAGAAATLGVAVASEAPEGEAWHRTKFPWTFAPAPIPSGSPGLGGFYHVFGPGSAPGSLDPIDSEPAVITNFNGVVGLAYISGNVTQTNTDTGEENLYPFVDSDMRFMKGTFRGTDGKEHQAAFAFV